MSIFNCDKEKLAAQFSADRELYDIAIRFFERFEKYFSPDFKPEASKAVDFLDKVNDFSRDSDYFVFKTDDGWARHRGVNGQGYTLFQLMGEKMQSVLGVDHEGVPSRSDVVSFLKSNGIEKVCTVEFYGNYFGLERCSIDEEDKFVLVYNPLDTGDIAKLKRKGIDVHAFKHW